MRRDISGRGGRDNSALRDISGRGKLLDSRHNFGVRSGIFIPLVVVLYISVMAAKNIDYNSWTLEELRAEASIRAIVFTSKDGVKTLASKLRVSDSLMTSESLAL